jgi:hypothetical protein
MVVSSQLHAPAALRPRNNPGKNWIWGWVGSRAGLDVLEKGNISCTSQVSDPEPSIQSAAHSLSWPHYPGYTADIILPAYVCGVWTQLLHTASNNGTTSQHASGSVVIISTGPHFIWQLSLSLSLNLMSKCSWVSTDTNCVYYSITNTTWRHDNHWASN